MIEILFSDSACASLRQAQHYGEGDFHGSVSVFCSSADGVPPTEAEIQAARQEAENRERRIWAQTVPMGGKAEDVFGFDLALSIGPITEPQVGTERRQVMEWLWSIYPFADSSSEIEAILEKARRDLETVLTRAAAGETLRFWISRNPDELCGFHWFLTQLTEAGLQNTPVRCIMLPELRPGRDGTYTQHVGCGEVSPHEWRDLLPLETPLSPALVRTCTARWRTLQAENAPLRAVLNGKLVSAEADLYDRYIQQELAAQAGEFREAIVVGNVLGKYQLGIGDAWVALRIEELIQKGELLVTKEADGDAPRYHRMLRKRA